MNVFVIMSHPLTEEQEEELQSRFQPDKFMYLPEELKRKWMNIPPEGPWNEEWVSGIVDWIRKQMTSGDIAIVQGEYGATFFLVNWLKQRGIRPYYATTERRAIEKKNDDGSVEIQRVFRHVNFRAYP